MQQEQTSSPTVLHMPYWPSKPAWAAYFCTLFIALGLCFWDAVHNTSPDTHPLQPDRLWLRVVGIFFMAVNFAIAGIAGFGMWRAATRRRKAQCMACGYDVLDATDRCPQCGSELRRSYVGGPMYCHGCQYDLRGSDGRCPECGRPFERSDPRSYARYPLSGWRVLGIKAVVTCDQWWVWLVWAIATVAAAIFIDSTGARVIFALCALWFLYWSLYRLRKGPPDYERMLRESPR